MGNLYRIECDGGKSIFKGLGGWGWALVRVEVLNEREKNQFEHLLRITSMASWLDGVRVMGKCVMDGGADGPHTTHRPIRQQRSGKVVEFSPTKSFKIYSNILSVCAHIGISTSAENRDGYEGRKLFIRKRVKKQPAHNECICMINIFSKFVIGPCKLLNRVNRNFLSKLKLQGKYKSCKYTDPSDNLLSKPIICATQNSYLIHSIKCKISQNLFCAGFGTNQIAHISARWRLLRNFNR